MSPKHAPPSRCPSRSRSPASGRPGNPYLGPYPFHEDDAGRFFGRRQETATLLSMIVSQGTVVLCAPSGAGKTSLVQAAVVPGLRRKGFDVLPVARVGGALPPELAADEVANVFAFNAAWSLAGATARPREVLGRGLGALLAPRYPRPVEAGLRRLLILDQFEEILTTHGERWRDREDFFRQLQDCLRQDPALSIVLVVREDYLPALERYAPLLPGRLRSRLRLEPLRPEAAMEAVVGPAEHQGVRFEPGAAEQLVTRLSQQPAAQDSCVLVGERVEPVYLQVVCFQLWHRLAPRSEQVITRGDLTRHGRVEQALESFYDDVVVAVSGGDRRLAERIRRWCEERLITPNGLRAQVIHESETTGELANDVVRDLAERHLVRPVTARGGVWYELAHDRFVDAVRRANERAAPAERRALQLEAQVWQRAGRPSALLSSPTRLARFEEATAGSHLTELEAEYLQRSRQRIRTRRLWWIAGLLALALAFVTVFGLMTWRQVGGLEAQRDASQALNLRQQNPARALEVALRGFERRQTSATRGALLRLLSGPLLARVQEVPLGPALTRPRRLAWAPGGGRLALAGEDGAVEIRQGRPLPPRLAAGGGLAAGQFLLRLEPPPEPPPRQRRPLVALAYAPSGRALAAGDEAGRIVWWDDLRGVGWRPGRLLFETPGGLEALAVSPQGRYLAHAGTASGVWDLEAGCPLPLPAPETALPKLHAVAFSPGGSALAMAGEGGRAFLWSVPGTVAGKPAAGSGGGAGSSPPLVIPAGDPAHALTSVAFGTAGRLAVGGASGAITVWQTDSAEPAPRRRATLAGHDGPVRDLAFSRDGRLLLSLGDDGRLLLWDWRRGLVLQSESFTRHAARALALDGEGAWLATLGAAPAGGGSLEVWQLLDSMLPPLGQGEAGDEGTPITAARFSVGGRHLGTISASGQILVWNVAEGGTKRGPRLRSAAAAGAFAFSHDDRWLAFADAEADRGPGGEARRGVLGLLELQHDPRQTGLRRLALEMAPLVAVSPLGPDAFGPAGGFRLVSRQGQVVDFDLGRAAFHPRLPRQEVPVLAARLARDGRDLVTLGSDHLLRRYDLRQEETLPPLGPSSTRVAAFALSQDGERLATLTADHRLLVWALPRAKVLHEVPVPGGELVDLFFLPDDRRLLLAAADGDLQMWDPAQPRELFFLAHQPEGLASLAVSPDESWLFVATRPGDATILPLERSGLVRRACERLALWQRTAPACPPPSEGAPSPRG